MTLKLVTDQPEEIAEEVVLSPEDKALLEKTDIHPVVYAKVCPVMSFKTQPDLLNGGDRKRRFAVVMSLNGIPNFHMRRDPLIVPSEVDSFLLDADTIEDLRARMIREIDLVLDQVANAAKVV
jgi:hypothetical protein